MNEYCFTVGEDDDGVRLDTAVSSHVQDISRSAAAKLAEDGLVLVEGKAEKKNFRLKAGDTVRVSVPPAEAIEAAPQDIPIDVVYEDSYVIVVNKPRGMVVHPAAGNFDGTLVNALLAHCGDSLSGINGQLRPGIVHRIDKDTSGLIVAAKNDAAHRSLAEQIKEHSAGRVYDAVVYGRMKELSGTVDEPIARHRTERKKMAVDKTGRRAVTHWETVSEYSGFTHIKCRLETGRTHQIRVHMAFLGHPVAGDPVYGPKKDKTGLGGQCLHASELAFCHPSTGEKMVFHAPLPDYFTDFLIKIGKGS